MKPVRFVGTARSDLAAFPKAARVRAGHELFMLHAFQKKTPRTSRSDLELAARRYRQARALAEAE